MMIEYYTQVLYLNTNEERENWDSGLNQKHYAGGGNTRHTTALHASRIFLVILSVSIYSFEVKYQLRHFNWNHAKKSLVMIQMFLERKISMLEWFLKDNVTLKTEVMVAKKHLNFIEPFQI